MIIIGERLNSSRRSILEAMINKDSSLLIAEALRQENAGARYIDLNAAALMQDEMAILEWIIPLIQKEVKVPLSIDTPSRQAMQRGLRLHEGKALMNSITGESGKLAEFLPLVREFQPRVIALCLDDEGIPRQAEKELHIALNLVDQLNHNGISPEDIFLDPLVNAVGASSQAAKTFLEALEKIKRHIPEINTVAGISNVSFGLPQRKKINRTFLAMAIEHGLDAAIINPLDSGMTDTILAAEALSGRDPHMKNYISSFRKR